MRSTKYVKHQASRYKNPTRIVNGVLVMGKNEARKEIESRLKRKLHERTTIKKTRGQWIFREPKNVGNV